MGIRQGAGTVSKLVTVPVPLVSDIIEISYITNMI